jgi:hypothetical protein
MRDSLHRAILIIFLCFVWFPPGLAAPAYAADSSGLSVATEDFDTLIDAGDKALSEGRLSAALSLYGRARADDSEAVRWYRKAADQGDAWAQNNLDLTPSFSPHFMRVRGLVQVAAGPPGADRIMGVGSAAGLGNVTLRGRSALPCCLERHHGDPIVTGPSTA